MSIENLIFCLHIGEEMDVRVDGKDYFLQPDYKALDKEQHFYPYTRIYDEKGIVFIGTTEEVMNYKFNNKYSFNEHLYAFMFNP